MKVTTAAEVGRRAAGKGDAGRCTAVSRTKTEGRHLQRRQVGGVW